MPKIYSDTERIRHKETLFEEGLRLFRDGGMKNITVEKLVQTINVSKGYFYSFFTSKEVFFLEAVHWKLDQNLERLKAAAADGYSQEELFDLFRDMVFYLSVRDVTGLAGIAQKVPAEDWEDFRRRLQGHFRAVLRLLGKRAGAHEVRVVINLISSVLMSNSLLANTPGTFSNVSEQTFNILLDSVVQYIQGLPDEKTGKEEMEA